MSKSKYKVTKGLAQVASTGEPVFVVALISVPPNNPYDPSIESARVVRPVVTQNGIEYREEVFPLEQLETRFEQAKRTVEFEAFVQGLREGAEQKRYQLAPAQQAAIRKNVQQLPLNFEAGAITGVTNNRG